MNRRDMLKTAAGLGLAALVPSWLLRRPDIDLSAFCCKDEPWRKFDMSQPFIQDAGSGLYKYATDARIAVRVDSEWRDANPSSELKLPPASGLPWKHDAYDGWKPWPKSEPLRCREAQCPTCNAKGRIGNGIEDCPVCEDFGHCDHCADIGFIGGQLCPECQGKRWGTFAGLQRVGDAYVGLTYDAKIRRHLRNVEYKVARPWNKHTEAIGPMVLFRFDGGLGLLCPIEDAERRIV